jgi:hypothetical protein
VSGVCVSGKMRFEILTPIRRTRHLGTRHRDTPPGGLLSVALSLVFRPVGVTHHHVLRSPDFPPAEDLCGLTAVLNQRRSSRHVTDSQAAVPSSAGDHPVRYRTVEFYDTEARPARQVRRSFIHNYAYPVIRTKIRVHPRVSESSAVIVKGTWVGLNLRQPNRHGGSILRRCCWPICGSYNRFPD